MRPSLAMQEPTWPDAAAIALASPTSDSVARPAALAGAAPFFAALAVLLLFGCDEEVVAPPKDAAQEDVGIDAEPDVVAAEVEPDVATEETEAPDVLDAVTPPDATPDVDVAVPTDVPACVTGTDCTELTLTACQQPTCDAGVCKATLKPGTCCDDTHCNDQIDCTADTCDLAGHTCTFVAISNCCSGKVTFAKAGFEDGSPGDPKALGDLKASDAATNGNVGWKTSTHRARNGKGSLYFGNECHTYDNSMSVEAGCKSGIGLAGATTPTAVTTALTSKEYALPQDKKAQLTFWLWLDAEPMYADTLPKGTCKTPCAAGSTCVSVNGASQCLPEKDVLQVNVLASDAVQPQFYSTAIGKTTKGQWQRIAIDLSAFAGKAVKLQWTFQTGTGLKNGFEGVYLDDVVVETLCAEGASCDDQTPCADDGNACSTEACTPYQNPAGKAAAAAKAGVCLFDKAPACCTLAGDCDDGNGCTLDACQAGVGGGKCSNVPDAAKPACCKPAVLLVDDFDGGDLSAWTQVGSNSNAVKWRVHSTGGVGKSQALYFGDEAFATFDDPSLDKVGPKGSLCTKPLTLKSGTLYDIVAFDLQLDTEWSGLPASAYKNPPISGQAKLDVLAVQVIANGAAAEVWSSDSVLGTTDGAFKPVTVVLDAWQGQTVQVCLTFDAGDGQLNGGLGAVVDNFAIKVACQKKACYFSDQCKNLSCNTCSPATCTDTGCACTKIPGCCVKDGDCNDGDDKCTTDKCKDGACAFTATGADGCPAPP